MPTLQFLKWKLPELPYDNLIITDQNLSKIYNYVHSLLPKETSISPDELVNFSFPIESSQMVSVEEKIENSKTNAENLGKTFKYINKVPSSDDKLKNIERLDFNNDISLSSYGEDEPYVIAVPNPNSDIKDKIKIYSNGDIQVNNKIRKANFDNFKKEDFLYFWEKAKIGEAYNFNLFSDYVHFYENKNGPVIFVGFEKYKNNKKIKDIENLDYEKLEDTKEDFSDPERIKKVVNQSSNFAEMPQTPRPKKGWLELTDRDRAFLERKKKQYLKKLELDDENIVNKQKQEKQNQINQNQKDEEEMRKRIEAYKQQKRNKKRTLELDSIQWNNMDNKTILENLDLFAIKALNKIISDSD